MLESLLPASTARAARRAGNVLLTLAALVAWLFPASAGAGTETRADRFTTVAALVVAGVALRLGAGRAAWTAAAVGAAAVGSLVASVLWILVTGVAAAAYVLASALRRAREPAPPPAPVRGPLAEAVRENVEAVTMALVLALVVREFAYEAFKIPTSSMEPTILGDKGGNPGDRLLASKWTTLVGDPPRWSIVVFKFPLFRTTNYIKRLVGLPGETLELRGGDVYVDGVVQAKPEAVQDSLWEDAGRAPGAQLRAGPDATWTELSASLAADHRVDLDLLVESAGPQGGVWLRSEGAGRGVTLEIDAQGARVFAPGVDGAPVDLPALEPGLRLRLGLGVADRVARVYRDGALVARVPHQDVRDPEEVPDLPRSASAYGSFHVGARDAAIETGEARLRDDLQYTQSGRWTTGPDEFFMLGDNTGNSRDSREWRRREIRTKDGRVFFADANAMQTVDEVEVRVFRETPEAYEFFDTDGVRRVLPRAEVESVRTAVPAPFVHRRDLIGRAFLVFFPFPPLGDTFRPRFLP